MKKTPLFVLLISLGFSLLQATAMEAQIRKPEEKVTKSLTKATEAFEDLTKMGSDNRIPRKLLNDAEGIVIFPGALKIALGVGGQGGSGFAVIKKENGEWSNPFFLDMGEASVGAQIGVQSADLILLFKKRKSIMGLEKADLTLGGDAGLAVGPVGRNASATTDLSFEAEIYSYSRSKGLYAGISLEGNVLTADRKANAALYGKKKISMREIFYDLETPYNSEIAAFLAAVDRSHNL